MSTFCLFSVFSALFLPLSYISICWLPIARLVPMVRDLACVGRFKSTSVRLTVFSLNVR